VTGSSDEAAPQQCEIKPAHEEKLDWNHKFRSNGLGRTKASINSSEIAGKIPGCFKTGKEGSDW
jgi:hypothetical protein